MYIEEMEENDYTDYVWDKLYQDWDVFYTWDSEIQERLIKAMYPENERDGDCFPFLHQYVENEAEYYGIGQEESEKLIKKWEQFSEEIRKRNRYFTTNILNLSRVKKLLKYLERTFGVGKIFYRARISHDGKRIMKSKMGKTTIEKAQDGRANPKGIPYLYLASSPRTTIAEVRPFINDNVTVGKFKVNKRLKVVDLRRVVIGDPFRYGEDLEEVVDYIHFLHKLGTELSKVINPREAEIEYVPTQYLSEFIKSLGYDGIVYGSSMIQDEAQFNIVIFNDENLKCISTSLHIVTKITHDSQKI